MPYFVESLLNVKEDAGTYFSSFHAFFYYIDDSVALLDCGVVERHIEQELAMK
jgi:hypothetical protein